MNWPYGQSTNWESGFQRVWLRYILVYKGWISPERIGFPRNLDSGFLVLWIRSMWTGRTRKGQDAPYLPLSLYIYIYIYIYIYTYTLNMPSLSLSLYISLLSIMWYVIHSTHVKTCNCANISFYCLLGTTFGVRNSSVGSKSEGKHKWKHAHWYRSGKATIESVSSADNQRAIAATARRLMI